MIGIIFITILFTKELRLFYIYHLRRLKNLKYIKIMEKTKDNSLNYDEINKNLLEKMLELKQIKKCKENKNRRKNEIKKSKFNKKEERENIKEKFKDLKELEKYLRENKAYPENLELLEYFDGGSECNTYLSTISSKKNNNKKKLIMKLIFADDKETRREAYMSSILKHTNVIDFYGYSPIEKGGNSLMLLDLAKYGNLRSFQRKTMKRMTFSESMICFLADQILKGIIYCHQSKIAHLDSKPQNIVVDEFLNAKLIDFSISLNYKNHSPEDELQLPFRGTNFYMSREVIKSERIKYKDLNKIDMYALGVLIYNLAYANYPYDLTHGDEEDYTKIYEKITNNPLIFPNDSEYSTYFKDFVSKLLEKDINKRMNMYEALNHYWINGAKILYDEKEKCYNAGAFVSYLLTDHIRDFNEYIQKQD